MAAGGFYYLSSPGSSSSGTAAEVEALIAEAADLVTLEQIARLNSAHIADDALLPADVESRFRRLKTFPTSSEARANPAPPARHCSSDKGLPAPAPTPAVEQSSTAEHENRWKTIGCSINATVHRRYPQLSNSGPPVDEDPSFKPAIADTVFPVKPGRDDRSEKRYSRGSGTHPSSPISLAASSSASPRGGSPSPPRGRACCFGFSPRRKGDPWKKGARDRRGDVGSRKGDSDRSLLPDLGDFSPREQRRSMRRAMEEEEKVLREAQRMVKWMKQASARMEVSTATVDELLSELEDEGNGK